MDSLSNKISEKLTLRCRHSPIKMRKTMISQRTRVCNEFDETHSYLPIKCRKCFSRNCSCTDKQKVDVNSLTTLRKLLREQTLIQEAVRRLKIKTSSSKEQLEVDHYKSFEGNSECISHYTSYDSESDLDCWFLQNYPQVKRSLYLQFVGNKTLEEAMNLWRFWNVMKQKTLWSGMWWFINIVIDVCVDVNKQCISVSNVNVIV